MNCHPYSKVNLELNVNERFLLQMKIFRMICNYAIKNNVKYILASGDIFEYFNPSSRERTEVFNLLSEYRDRGLIFFIIDGNHDTNGFWSALGYLGKLKAPDINVVSGEPRYFEELGLACYPYMPGQTVESIKREFKDKPNKNILMLHGAIVNALNWKNTSCRDMFDLSELFDLGFNYTAIGDLHTNQSWNNGEQYIAYPGNIMAKDFTEFDSQQKYFMDVEIADGKVNVKKIKLPIVNPLLKYDFDSEVVDTQFGTKIKFNFADFKNSIVKVIVSKNNPDFRQKQVLDSIYEKGASFVFAEQRSTTETSITYSDNTSIDSFKIEDVISEFCTQKGYDTEFPLKIYKDVKEISNREKLRDIE